MNKDKDKVSDKDKISKVGQGFNDARGEIPDKEDIPKHNGLNVNNDPNHHRANEKPRVKPVKPTDPPDAASGTTGLPA